MKIHLLSDLHLEFEQYTPSLEASKADIVLLAGDIGVKGRGVDWAREAFSCPVIYVPGNHSYFREHIDLTLEKMRATSCDRVRVLDNEEWILGGVRFLGATCWTDYTSTGNSILAKYEAQRNLNDFRKIRTAGYRKVKPDDLVLRNQISLAWLRDRLAEPFEGPTVVVTHHAPSLLSFGNARAEGSESHLDASYANSWESLMGGSVALWVHGHVHRAADYNIKGTRIVCNPRGYPGEPTGFNPDLLITLKGHCQEAVTRERFNSGQLVAFASIISDRDDKVIMQVDLPENSQETRPLNTKQLDEILRSYAAGNIARRNVEEATGLWFSDILEELGCHDLQLPRVDTRSHYNDKQLALFDTIFSKEMKISLIVTDASPLVSLAIAGALDALLQVKVIIPDMVNFEVTQHIIKPGSRELLNWISANQLLAGQRHAASGVFVESTETFNEFKILQKLNPSVKTKNRGEQAAAEILVRELENRLDAVILLFEDSDIRKANFLVRHPDNVLVMSTSTFIEGMQQGNLSADEILRGAVLKSAKDKSRGDT